MPDPMPPGLRERKRLATRRTLQLCALQLALEKGLSAVTVEEISRRAEVSPRTFFNYFPSKEAVIAGDGLGDPGEVEIERFLSAGPDEPLGEGVRRLLLDVARGITLDREVLELRRRVSRIEPSIVDARFARLHRVEARLVEIVEERLRRDGRDVEQNEQAALLVYVGIAALRHAWRRWVASVGGDDVEVLVNESYALLPGVLGSPSGS